MRRLRHDFIELTDTGSQDETLTGWSLKDDTDSHNYPIDDSTGVPEVDANR